MSGSSTHDWSIELPEGEEIELEVDFSWTDGGRPIPPSFSHPGDPGWPPEVEIEAVRTIDGAELCFLPAERDRFLGHLFDCLGPDLEGD